jgi:hypothetical protein
MGFEQKRTSIALRLCSMGIFEVVSKMVLVED